jgi:two-component system, LytTR family, response regulator LytT
MNIVIIEDEHLTAEALADTLVAIDESIVVIKTLASIKQALAYFGNAPQNIDLIFSDIQLGDGISFEIFKTINITTPIIFCTAYDDYALQAFNSNGIDYVLKPFDDKSINKAITKYKNLKGLTNATSSITLQEVYSLIENKYKPKAQSLLVFQGDKIIPIKTIEIAYFMLENEITYLKCFNDKQYTISSTLDALEQELSTNFYRANRQFIINKNAVKEVSQYFARKLLVLPIVHCTEPIIISKAKTTEFLNWLKS